jgi:hypothetical protein
MKMVETLLHIEAKEDTIAATNAAKIKPLRPLGIKFIKV